MKRPIVRPEFGIVPLAITQHNACIVLGFKTPRSYIDWVITHGVPHARRGKDVIVEASTALRYLVPPPEKSDAVETPAPLTAEEETHRVLALFGRKLVR